MDVCPMSCVRRFSKRVTPLHCNSLMLHRIPADGGRCVPQSIYSLYQPSTHITLQEFIIMFGAVQLLLSQLPDIHTLRHVNYLATFCTVAFATVVVAMSIHNGAWLQLRTAATTPCAHLSPVLDVIHAPALALCLHQPQTPAWISTPSPALCSAPRPCWKASRACFQAGTIAHMRLILLTCPDGCRQAAGPQHD